LKSANEWITTELCIAVQLSCSCHYICVLLLAGLPINAVVWSLVCRKS